MNQLPFIFNFISKMVILKKNNIYLALKFRVINFLSSLNPIAVILAKSKHSAVNGAAICAAIYRSDILPEHKTVRASECARIFEIT